MSKEKQLAKLNRLQLEKLQRTQKLPQPGAMDGSEIDEDDDLEIRRRNHKMQSILHKHEIASTFQRKYPKMIHFLQNCGERVQIDPFFAIFWKMFKFIHFLKYFGKCEERTA